MTREELLKLADECCAANNCTHGPSLVKPIMDALELSGGYEYERVNAALFLNSWDAFVALLPEGMGWLRCGVRISVWTVGVKNGHPAAGIDTHEPQPRHGVAAILRAMAEEVTE